MTAPKLRFPEFQDSWTPTTLKSVLRRVSNPVNVDPNSLYREIGIRSHGKGIFHKEPVKGKSLGNKRVFHVASNLFVVNIVFAWERAIAVTSEAENGMIASHRFPMFSSVENKSNVHYFREFFITPRGKYLLTLASPGGAGRNKTLGQSNFENLNFEIPSQAEQNKIADFLAAINEKISLLTEEHRLLTLSKEGLMQKIFKQEVRFKDNDGNEFPDWTHKKLSEVSKKKASSISANKIAENIGQYKIYGASGVLKTVDFYSEEAPYISVVKDGAGVGRAFLCEGKSSVLGTMEMVLPLESMNTKYLFELINRISFRKYITGSTIPHVYYKDYSLEIIPVPNIHEQEKIANFLSALNEKISNAQRQLELTKQFKQGLLQQMFA